MSFVKKVQNDQLIIQINELIMDYPQAIQYKMDSKNFPKKKDTSCLGCSKKSAELLSTGHSKKCIYSIARKNFEYLFSYLNRYEKDNLELILQEINY
jgi:hypothetical protein